MRRRLTLKWKKAFLGGMCRARPSVTTRKSGADQAYFVNGRYARDGTAVGRRWRRRWTYGGPDGGARAYAWTRAGAQGRCRASLLPKTVATATALFLKQ
jgi:hypothetical protein